MRSCRAVRSAASRVYCIWNRPLSLKSLSQRCLSRSGRRRQLCSTVASSAVLCFQAVVFVRGLPFVRSLLHPKTSSSQQSSSVTLGRGRGVLFVGRGSIPTVASLVEVFPSSAILCVPSCWSSLRPRSSLCSQSIASQVFFVPAVFFVHTRSRSRSSLRRSRFDPDGSFVGRGLLFVRRPLLSKLLSSSEVFSSCAVYCIPRFLRPSSLLRPHSVEVEVFSSSVEVRSRR